MRNLPPPIRAVLLDIEGTVGDLRFVADVLFPYARARIAPFVAEHGSSPEIAPVLAEAARLSGAPTGDRDAVVRALLDWSDANAKIPPLKELQGLIWRAGYRDGALRAHVYDDVPRALRAFRDRGLVAAIYSSGSVLAQRLYFGSTIAGDLTSLVSAWFDTAVGAKGDRASYEAIAGALGERPEALAFFTDAPLEVGAARAAGLRAVRVDRSRAAGDSGRDSAGNEWWGSIEEIEPLA